MVGSSPQFDSQQPEVCKTMTSQSVAFIQLVMFFGGLYASDGDSLAGDTTNPHRIPSAGTN